MEYNSVQASVQLGKFHLKKLKYVFIVELQSNSICETVCLLNVWLLGVKIGQNCTKKQAQLLSCAKAYSMASEPDCDNKLQIRLCCFICIFWFGCFLLVSSTMAPWTSKERVSIEWHPISLALKCKLPWKVDTTMCKE